jgi:hypothetical protein
VQYLQQDNSSGRIFGGLAFGTSFFVGFDFSFETKTSNSKYKSRSFDSGGKRAAFAQDDTSWGELRARALCSGWHFWKGTVRMG